MPGARVRERGFSPRALAALAALALCACAQGATKAGTAFGVPFSGPGSMLLVFEHAKGRRELVLYEPGGARRIEIPAFREVRFVKPDLLALVLEAPAEADATAGATQLALYDLATGTTRRFGPVGRQYDIEPSPDGRYLALGSEREEIGEADFELWSLEGEPKRLAWRPQALERPRWREDGRELAVALLMQDPESDSDTEAGFGWQSLGWPRLHRLSRDLSSLQLIPDGAEPGQLAPGGSLPLWWDARGLYARQREGLMRCDAQRGGCTRVVGVEPERRVVDGRPVGAREAWLLTVEASDAFDQRDPDAIVRVDLETGTALWRWRAPPGISVLDLDWIGD